MKLPEYPKLKLIDWVDKNVDIEKDVFSREYILDCELEKHGGRAEYVRFIAGLDRPLYNLEKEYLLDFADRPNIEWKLGKFNREKDDARFTNWAMKVEYLYLIYHDELSGKKAAKQLAHKYNMKWKSIWKKIKE